MSFAPYIHFQGNCAEALKFYAEVFGASEHFAMTYAEAPDAPPEIKGSKAVMHGSITVDGSVLMASDFPPGMKGEPQQAVSVSWGTEDVARARSIYDRLVQGGEPVMPFAATFWSEGFGMLKDRFGTHWMISGPQKPMN